MILTVQKVIHAINKGIRQENRNGVLSVADIHFINLWDEATTMTHITDAFNLVLSGSPMNKFKIPCLVKLVFLIIREFSRYCPITGVNLGAITRYVVFSIYDSGAISILDTERPVIRESIDSSVFLLMADMPIIKGRRFGCIF